MMIRYGVVKGLVALAALLTCGRSATVAADAEKVVFHVSSAGNDASDGSETKPFATLERARQAVRTVNKDMTGDLVVLIHGGTYRIEQTLAFNAEDSGTNGHAVIYRAAAGETPIISGGKAIGDWSADENGRWKAVSPIDDFRQLYVNGKRADRASGPAPKDFHRRGEEGWQTSDTALADWRNAQDVEVRLRAVWCDTRCKVEDLRREGDLAVAAMQQPFFAQAMKKEGAKLTDCPSDKITIENALELLDEPGEWYLDRPTHTVYYLPRPGEAIDKTTAIAPAIERLVELRGDLDAPVHDVRFEGITFAHGGWLLPNKEGFLDIQANFMVDLDNLIDRNGDLATVHNQYLKSPSNVVCHAAKSLCFERCTFTQLGSGGIDLEFGSQDNVIRGCRFVDISGTAVQVGDVLENDHHPKDPRMIVKDNAVVDNTIHNVAVEYLGGVGVFAGYTEGTVIAHNEIAQLPYSGISVGWGWGEEDAGGGAPSYYQPSKYDTPTPAKRNRIEFNHIHHVMLSMHDGGGIYTLGNMPKSSICGNYIHDNPGEPGGIYLDEGSGFLEVVGNLVKDVPTPMNFNNRVQDRIKTCKVHGNSFGKRSNVTPEEGPENAISEKAAQEIADHSGLEAVYRDLLE